MNNYYDIVIAGGGLVGASLAVALAPSGKRVAVVESTPPSAAQPSFDDRATALAPTSCKILATLGVFPDSARVSPIVSIHVSDRGRFGSTRMHSAQHGVSEFGFVVENRLLGDTLWAAMRGANIDLFCPARISSATQQVGGIALKLDGVEGDGRIDAGLVVVAEGAASSTRDLLEAPISSTDYKSCALVANVATARAHEGRAFERFTKHGPLAMLPLTGGRMNVVWSVPGERVAALVADDEQFTRELQETFGYRLGHITRVGQRISYPLVRTVAGKLYGDHWVLIGNAAHSVHPVAGQGLNLGLRDMAALAELAIGHEGNQWSALLADYVDWRRADHRHVLRMTNSLVKVFGHDGAPVGLARDAALVALQILPPARRWFARRSMGYRTRLPRLARGIPLA